MHKFIFFNQVQNIWQNYGGIVCQVAWWVTSKLKVPLIYKVIRSYKMCRPSVPRQWSRGTMGRCHRLDPGSSPGWRTSFFPKSFLTQKDQLINFVPFLQNSFCYLSQLELSVLRTISQIFNQSTYLIKFYL